MKKEFILSNIKWSIDHDYGVNYFMLVGDFNGSRFVQGVRDGLFGIPLAYKRWCIERRFIFLYKNTKEQ